MIRGVIGVIALVSIIGLSASQPAIGQPELVPIQCNETLTESASCPGPFIICDRQYVLEVPEGTTKMVIDLRPPSGVDGTWDLDLFVNRGEPVDQNRLGETVVAFADEIGPDTITLPSGRLVPGTYYIAVANPNEAPQPFELTVTLDPCRKCSEEQEQLAQNAIRLEPNRVETGSVGAITTGASSLAERQYAIEITKDTRALAIALRSESGGNIDLHLQRDCALATSSREVVADFSLVSPTGFEFMLIKGVQLKIGTYYLAVENRESIDQQFSIAAAAIPLLSGPFRANSSADGRVDFQGQELLDFLKRLLQTAEGALAITQYVLEVESGVKAINIDIEGSGPLHLHLRFEKPVEIADGRVIADVSSLGLSGVKSVRLSGALLRPGKYFVAIEGLATETQDFIISFSFERDGTTTEVTKKYQNPSQAKPSSGIEIER